jgi:hypothetical protein
VTFLPNLGNDIESIFEEGVTYGADSVTLDKIVMNVVVVRGDPLLNMGFEP